MIGLNVLLVEDNKSDVRIIKKALDKHNVHVENDGEEAIEYLKNNRPNLIILDLNLLKVDGKEVIRFIKSHPQLRTIPVVVYTTSRNKDDIDQLYRLGANAYVSKPFNLSDARQVIEALGSFWNLVSYAN